MLEIKLCLLKHLIYEFIIGFTTHVRYGNKLIISKMIYTCGAFLLEFIRGDTIGVESKIKQRNAVI